MVGLLLLLLVLGVAWYLINNPRRDAEKALAVIRQVEPGKTTAPELLKIVKSSGLPAAGYWKCEPDLDSSVSHPPLSEFPALDTLLPRTTRPEPYCVYFFGSQNFVLDRLGLAPPTDVLINLTTHHQVLTDILLEADIGDYNEIAHLRFLQSDDVIGSSGLLGCDQEVCVKSYDDGNGTLRRIYIPARASLPASRRDSLLDFNIKCLSKIGGCKTAEELLPSVRRVSGSPTAPAVGDTSKN